MGQIAHGIGVSAGIAFGEALIMPPAVDFDANQRLGASQLDAQQQVFADACEQLAEGFGPLLAQFAPDSPQAQLLDAELMILQDDEFTGAVNQAITTLHLPAHVAVHRVTQQHADELQAMDDDYLAARGNDILSLGQRLIRQILGEQLPDLHALTTDTIIIAEDMTPAEFTALPLTHIVGLVLTQGGLTSHTAILARAAGIPALLNCDLDRQQLTNGCGLILNANAQTLHIDPSAQTVERLKASLAEFLARQTELEGIRDLPCQTRDGQAVPLLANVGCEADIDQLLGSGGEGVGLLRTELMLLNAATLPDEDTQYKVYLDCLRRLDGKPFTVRTLDIGADKALAALKLPAEANPALGNRGIRYSLSHPDLFRSQLRALLRVANHGPVKLMFPMINQPEELDAVLQELELCRQHLLERELGFGDPALGIVVETPAAALNLDSMLPLLDFVSIGTNDLTQYTMAADRTVPELTRTFPALSPPLLKLIKLCIDATHARGLRVSMCGELAGNPAATALLLGMGLDEFSLSPSGLLEVKEQILITHMTDARLLAQKALKCQRLDELHSCLATVNCAAD
ncbi:phosphoenolpyruvate--protein phosphotransferase [Shewanella sp. GXUN23E]|uniref:phosphoenolpyruvate--protein phosphotransferase n=1 Tax=Shewanella sp. GXUN23E TaxID=3422498 RepID=UPI003D7E4AFC